MSRIDVNGLVKEVYNTPDSDIKAYFGENTPEKNLMKELEESNTELSVNSIQNAKSITNIAKEKARFKYGFIKALQNDKESLDTLYDSKESALINTAAVKVVSNAIRFSENLGSNSYVNKELLELNSMYLYMLGGISKSEIKKYYDKGYTSIDLVTMSYWFNDKYKDKYLEDILSKGLDYFLFTALNSSIIPNKEIGYRRASGDTLEVIGKELGVSREAIRIKDNRLKSTWYDLCIDVLRRIAKDRVLVSDREVKEFFDNSEYLTDKEFSLFCYVIGNRRIDKFNGFVVEQYYDKLATKLVSNVEDILKNDIFKKDIENKVADLILRSKYELSLTVDDLLAGFEDLCFISDYIMLYKSNKTGHTIRSIILKNVIDKYYPDGIDINNECEELTDKINTLIGNDSMVVDSEYVLAHVKRSFKLSEKGFIVELNINDVTKDKVNSLVTEFIKQKPGLYITFNAIYSKFREEFERLGVNNSRALHGIFRSTCKDDNVAICNFSCGYKRADGSVLPLKEYIDEQSFLSKGVFNIKGLVKERYVEPKFISVYTNSKKLIRYSTYRYMSMRNIDWSDEEKKAFIDTLEVYVYNNILGDRTDIFNALKQTNCGEFIEKYDIENVNEFRNFIIEVGPKDISDIF